MVAYTKNTAGHHKTSVAKKKVQRKASVSSPPQKTSGSFSNKKDKIFRFLCEQHVMGIEESEKQDIALAVGNSNTRSEGFAKPLKELVETDGLVANKGSGNNKASKKGDTFYALTEAGIAKIPQDLGSSSQDPSQKHERYIQFVQNKVKGGKDKVGAVWDILKDGKAHRVEDIATKLNYSNARSFGNTKIITTMKDMRLVEEAGKGAVKFTDKAL